MSRRLRTIAGFRSHLHGLRPTSLDLDLLGFDLLRLRDAQRQHAVLEGGLRLVAGDADRQLDLTAEGPIPTLAVQVLVAVDLLIGLEFATNLKGLAGEGDVDLLRLDARKGRGDDDLVSRL